MAADQPHVKAILTRSGLFVDLAPFGSRAGDVAKRLIHTFTIREKNIMGHIVHHTTVLWQKDKNRVILPRGAIALILGGKVAFRESLHSKIKYCEASEFSMSNFRVKSTIPHGNKVKLVFGGVMTPNQKIVIKELFANYLDKTRASKGAAHVTLNLRPGQGKTYVAAACMGMIHRKTLVIVPNTPLLDQWIKVLHEVFPNNQIGHYSGTAKKDGDIVVAIVNSMCKNEMQVGGQTLTDLDFFAQFGFIVYDEAHEYTGAQRRKLLSRASARYVLGLSGTPYENTRGLDPLIWWTVGPVLDADKLPGFEDAAGNFQGEVHCVRYYGPDCYTEHKVNDSLGITSATEIISQICEDPTRTELIILAIKLLLGKKRNIFVFADRKSYLLVLQKTMQARQMESMILEDADANELSTGKPYGASDDESGDESDDESDDESGDSSTKEVEDTEDIEDADRPPVATMDKKDLQKKIKLSNGKTTFSKILTGGGTKASTDDMNVAENQSKVILTTYSYLGTGRSIPKMDAVVFCTPRRSKSKQYVNRIFRLGSDEKIKRYIVDIVDMRVALSSQWQTRQRYYKDHQYPIIKHEIVVDEDMPKNKVASISLKF